VLEAQVRYIEAQSDFESLKDQFKEMQEQLNEAKTRMEALERGLKEKKTVAQKRQQAVQQAIEQYGQDEIMEFIGERTLEEVDAEISAREGRLDAIEAQNPHALREFEALIKNIDKLKSVKSRREQEFAETADRITRIRAEFEPRLDELVGQINRAFSYNFEQINCAGEVDVHKDEEDFDKWAIEIRVRFREGETMQILDQHRQSGGERAVSTIFYLMSLQAMAQAPFRVVDEINQGMDPRNERMVHERMVEIACREHTSQYFLITPKLLTDLRYDERMRVHCIASGEQVPSLDDRQEKGIDALDFAKCVEIQRRVAAARAYPTPEPAPVELGQ
jgi:chromosome segregation ATPase